MFAAVGTESHQYELEMNGPIVCVCVCVCVCAPVGIVEMKNDAKYERAAPALVVAV
jgi:hypothetical protein